jgi:Protein of unknown function (DUF4058)
MKRARHAPTETRYNGVNAKNVEFTTMQPVRSVKNQYVGINAHLHSFWQEMRLWHRFHNVHITLLMQALKAQLRPMGYTAEIEDSLQIRRLAESPRYPKADILIRDLESQRAGQLIPPAATPGTRTLPALEVLLEDEDREHPYSAVAIYPAELGEPVAWVELLSPSNKGGGLDARVYRDKRTERLHNGLVFVEIDYLHETPPAFWRLEDYTQGEPDSHAYRILIFDPRPAIENGTVQLGEFDVDAPIPIMTIPLNAGDSVNFDFGVVYQKTFAESFYGDSVDYRELPQNFERYSKNDQARIARRMAAVLEAVKNGVDLESGPFPLPDLGLEAALERIKML